MKFTIKIIYALFLFISINSCSNRILITTTPSEVEIEIGEKAYTSPKRVTIQPDTLIKFSKDGYIDRILRGTKLLATDNRTINIVMEHIKYTLFLDINSTHNLTVSSAGQIFEKPYSIPMGEYKFTFSKDNYFSQDIVVNLDQNKKILVNLIKKYEYINIPNDILSFTINGIEYDIDEPFPIKDPPSYKPIFVEFYKSDESFSIGLTNNDYYMNIIDLQKLISETVFFNNNFENNEINIESSWIQICEESNNLRYLEMVATGFGGNYEGETRTNSIVRNPQHYLPNVSIINPTESIIGSTVIVSMNNEENKYFITDEFYRENLKNVYTTTYSGTREINKKQEYLKIDNYNFNAPFNNSTISVKLIKEDRVIDETLLTAGKDKNINKVTGDYDYHLYNSPRNNFFYNSKSVNSNQKYLYVDPKLSNNYLIIYKKELDSDKYVPIGLYKSSKITEEPALITFKNSTNSIYFVYMIRNLNEISDLAIFDFKSFNNN